MLRARLTRFAALGLLSTSLLSTPCAAQGAAPSPGARTIEVDGIGEAKVTPDLAMLQLAIQTRAATAADSASANSRLAGKGSMWTGGYSLFPEYNEPRDGGRPSITGYRAENSITLQTGDLQLVGPLIDTAIAAGANMVSSLDYTLRDDTKARSDAIAKASHAAQAQAQALAASLNVKLGPVIKASTVSEVRPLPMQTQFRATMMSTNAPTPVEPGQVSVPATVSLTYGIQ
jgi:uncharacterized protein YggE